MYVLRIDSLAGQVIKTAGEIGGFIEAYDPDAFDGGGDVKTTGDPMKALHFDTPEAAMLCYRQASRVRPLREDGRPNRPLTAFTVELMTLKAALAEGKGDV